MSRRAFRLLDFGAIMRDPLPPVNYLVAPLITAGSRVMLYAEWATYKTFLMLHLALHLAAGRPWLGKFAVPAAKRVLYVDEEMPEYELRRRIQRLAIGAGLDAEQLPFRALSRQGLRVKDGMAKALLLALDKHAFDPEVIIVDSFRRVLVGSENESEKVADFWRLVDPLVLTDDPANDRTLIVTHHMRKYSAQGNNDVRNRASGSTDILAGVDAGFALSRQRKDVVVVECVKARHAEEPTPFIVTVSDDGPDSPMRLEYSGTLADSRAESTKVGAAVHAIADFLLTCEENATKRGEIVTELETRGFATRTAERALTEAKKENVIHQLGGGRWQLVLRPLSRAA
jgi:hypothetical protein